LSNENFDMEITLKGEFYYKTNSLFDRVIGRLHDLS